jgi:hypothetical protein
VHFWIISRRSKSLCNLNSFSNSCSYKITCPVKNAPLIFCETSFMRHYRAGPLRKMLQIVRHTLELLYNYAKCILKKKLSKCNVCFLKKYIKVSEQLLGITYNDLISFWQILVCPITKLYVQCSRGRKILDQ